MKHGENSPASFGTAQDVDAEDTLLNLLHRVPGVKVIDINRAMRVDDAEIDLEIRVKVADRLHHLIVEIKANGQPRLVRAAVLQVRDTVALHFPGATPLVIAPYLSPESRAICQAYKVGFVDLCGNAWLALDGLYIDREVAGLPPAERREIKSIYKPKSAQVLRLLLRDPKRTWRMDELAKKADVSLGHISNVKTALIEREWAESTASGLRLTAPDKLLDSWRDHYEPPAGTVHGYYTTHHSQIFDRLARATLLNGRDQCQSGAFAGASAAQWLAPYMKVATQTFYADGATHRSLVQNLDLVPSMLGANVRITVLKDMGPLQDTIEVEGGAICTSAVQTYLDLTKTGERGQEAAAHLRREKLQWAA